MEKGNIDNHGLLEQMPDPFVCCRRLTAGNSADYVLFRANEAFAVMTGLAREEILDRKVTEVLPGTGSPEFDWNGIFSKADLTGKPVRFEQYFESFQRWYEITAYRNTPGVVAMIFRDVTAHRLAADALRKSKEELSVTLHSIGDGVISTDLQGRVVRMNPVAERLTGWSISEASGKLLGEVFAIINNKTGEPAQDPVRRVLETGTVVGMANHTALLSREGLKYQISDSAAPIRDQQGNTSGVIMVFSDVTAEYASREALLASEERYRTLVDHANVAIVVAQDGMHRFANPMAEDLFGYPAEILTSKPILEFIHPEDRQHLIDSHMKRLKGEDLPPGYIHRIITGNGEVRWVESRNVIIEWEGRPASLTFLVDITERKQAADALRESETKNRAILNTFPDLMFINNKDGVFLEYYAADKELPAAQPEQFIGKSVRDVLPEDLAAKLLQSFARAQETEQMQNLVFSLAIPGVSGYFEARITPVDSQRLLTIVRDITDRKEAELKLADYTLELEQLYHQLDEELDKARRVHERTLPAALPTIEGISFAAHYEPAQKLGGDFYNVIHNGNKLIFYLSDVSGHGLDGAMLSVFVKEAIDSYIALKPDEIHPAKILQHLDQQFYKESYPEEYFISIFMGVLDLEHMELTYSGAGFQDTPLLQLGNGEQVKLITRGLFINSYQPKEPHDFYQEQIALTPGTTIFCNTDGLTEQSSDSSFYMERLPDVFFQNAHLSPHLITRIVVEDLRRFTGGFVQGKDDITFLVLQLDPPEKKKHILELNSNLKALSFFQEKVLSLLDGIDEEIANAFITGLYESTANAVEHGNRFDPQKKAVVYLTITEDYLQAIVQDQGEGFNWQEKIARPLELDGSTERGRGIPMTRICSEKMYYNEKGNQVTIMVRTSD